MNDNDKRPSICIELGLYSVQWFEADPGPCCQCSREVGMGPAGFSTGDPAGPLCDGCLMLGNQQLGNLLWLAHMARELADKATGLENPWQADQCLVTLMTFAKIYDQGAEWPRREARAAEFMKALQARLLEAPWEDLLRSVGAPAG